MPAFPVMIRPGRTQRGRRPLQGKCEDKCGTREETRATGADASGWRAMGDDFVAAASQSRRAINDSRRASRCDPSGHPFFVGPVPTTFALQPNPSPST